MDILEKLFGGAKEDPRVNALIDTNHKLTLIHAAMCENYTQQVADLKQRIAVIEVYIQEKLKQQEKT